MQMSQQSANIVKALVLVSLIGLAVYGLADQNNSQEEYKAAPMTAEVLRPGIQYEVEHAPDNMEAAGETGTFTLYRSQSWANDAGPDEQAQSVSLADSDLNSARTDRLRASHPFLADILDATPTGATYSWWVSASEIPDTAAGFEAQDQYIRLQVVDRVAGFPAPESVDQIPVDARLSERGVGIKWITRNPDGVHPTLEDDIEVHYTGWQADGEMFGSTKLTDTPATFPLGRLIAGWQDALPYMRTGERALIWIPGDLAYDLREDRPFAPKGMLIFEVDLIAIPGPSEAQQ